MLKHYVQAFAPTRGGRQRALCGRYVNPFVDHSDDPNCPNCRHLIEQELDSRPNEPPEPRTPMTPMEEERERVRAGAMFDRIRQQVHQPLPKKEQS